MEKRTLLAVTLALLILLVWSVLFPPPPPQKGPAGHGTVPSGSPPGAGATSSPPGLDRPGGSPASPSKGASGAGNDSVVVPKEKIEAASEERITVDTGLAEVVLFNRGGRVVSWSLRKYTDDAGRPYQLVSPASAKATPPTYPLELLTDDEAINRSLAAALFVSRQETVSGGDRRVSLRWSDGKGLEAEKTLTFHTGTYFCDIAISVRTGGHPVKASVLWGPGIGGALQQQRTSSFDYLGRAVIGSEAAVERIPARSVTSPRRVEGGLAEGAGRIDWAGLEEQYFAAFFLPAEGSGGTTTGLEAATLCPFEILPAPGEKLEKHLAVAVRAVDGSGVARPLRLYAGPKEYERLKAVGYGAQQLVYFAQPAPLIGSILGPVIGLLAQGLYLCLRWLYGLVPNWGVSIILLTAGIKLAFYPITQRSFVKMRRWQQRMQVLQPRVKAIQERYRKLKGAEARQKMNQEVMELYRKEGINPMAGMSGCLPMLIQLPFLYAMYNVLTVSIELRRAPFLGWIKDLATKDPYYVTPVLMGATMFLQQKMAMTKITDPQQRAQQKMMMLMPVMFTAMFLNLPSGLTLYWFVSNLLQIGQQALINRQADRLLAAPQGASKDSLGRLKTQQADR